MMPEAVMTRTTSSRIAGAFLAVMLLSSPACAQTYAEVAKARELLELSGTLKITLEAITLTLPTQLEAAKAARPDIPDEFWDEFSAVFVEELQASSGAFATEFAEAYATRFSVEEMDEIIAFYRSDVGQKALSEMPNLMRQGMDIGQKLGAEIGARAGKRALENMRQRGAEP
jgi:hypothetical protein